MGVSSYDDIKVYHYDERWEFRKVGLLQWLDPKYIKEGQYFSADIPKVKTYRELQQKWASEGGQVVFWKKHLDPRLQPQSPEES